MIEYEHTFTKADLQPDSGVNNGVIWVLLDGERRGFLAWTRDQKTGKPAWDNWKVPDGMEGKGIGTQLIKFAFDYSDCPTYPEFKVNSPKEIEFRGCIGRNLVGDRVDMLVHILWKHGGILVEELGE